VNEPLSPNAKKVLNCCRQGQLDQLLQLLDSGVDVEAVNHPEFAPLNVALKHGRWKIAEHFLATQCMPNESHCPPLVAATQFAKDMTRGLEMVFAHTGEHSGVDKNGRSALMTACLLGHEKKVRYLLQHAEDLDAQDHMGMTAFLDAVLSNNHNILQLLIEHEADVNLCNHQDENALLIATQQPTPNTKIIKTLLENQVDCCQKNKAGKSAFSVAEKKHPHIHKMMVAKLEADKQMELPLFTAADDEVIQPAATDHSPSNESQTDAPQHQAENKPQPILTGATSQPSQSHRQAWFEAISNGNLGRLNQLKLKGVPIDLVDNKGCSGLVHAAGKGHRAVASYLIQNQANIEHRSDNGSTPLSSAVISQSRSLVGLLLSHGANPNLCGPGGYSYLALAASQWSEACVSMLLDAGADINSRDEAGLSLYHHVAIAASYYANTAKAKATIRLLKQHGLDINSQDHQGQSALHVLCGALSKDKKDAHGQHGDDSHIANIAHEMLKCGIDPKLVNHQGFTAIQYAKQQGLLNTKGVILSFIDAF